MFTLCDSILLGLLPCSVHQSTRVRYSFFKSHPVVQFCATQYLYPTMPKPLKVPPKQKKAKLKTTSAAPSNKLPPPNPVLDQLPDLPLLLIMSYLPLVDLIHRVPLVCSHLRRIQPQALSERTRLSLLVNDSERILARRLEPYESIPSVEHLFQLKGFEPQADDQTPVDYPGTTYTRLCLPTLSPLAIDSLMLFFPNVSSLEIVVAMTTVETLHQIALLLKTWKDKLITLHYVEEWENEPTVNNPNFILFFKQVNELSVLQSFAFHTNIRIFEEDKHETDYYEMSQIDLPILATLHEFKFCSKDYAFILIDSFIRYAYESTSLHTIVLLNEITLLTDQEDLMDGEIPDFLYYILRIPIDEIISPLLNSKFREMNIEYEYILNTMIFHSHNLTALRVAICGDDMTIPRLARRLAKHTQLRELSIEAYSFPSLSFFEEPAAHVTSLHSVTSLHLTIHVPNHTAMDDDHLAHVFPAVEEIKIDYEFSECTICNIDCYNPRPTIKEEVQACANLLTTTWRRCPNLKRIYVRLAKNNRLVMMPNGDEVRIDSLLTPIRIDLP